MKMLVVKIIKVSVIFSLIFLFCSTITLGTELYINTNPIDSKVYIDGIAIGNTPVRVKINNKVSIDIKIIKDGYKQLKKTITMNNKRVLNFYFDLATDKIELILSDKGKVINICGMPVGETPAILYNVPNGMYEIIKSEKSYDINPAGYRYAIRSTAVESIYSGGLLTLFLLGMNNLNNKGDNVGTAVTGFGSAIMAAILSYNLLKLFKLKVAREEAKIEVKKIKYRPYNRKDDRILFTEGVSLLGQKDYRRAIQKFSLLTKLYTDSQYVPISYYELGFSYYNLKDYSSTINVLGVFLNRYPVYEVYQYAFYYYMDSLIKMNRYNQAFLDYKNFRPLIIEDESGSLYKIYFKMLIELYKKNETHYRRLLNDIVEYMDYYIKKYPESSAFPDIMILKAEVLYRYLNREKGLKMIDELKRIYSKDKKIMEKVESIIVK